MRTLELETGFLDVAYAVGDVSFRREDFASYPGRVLAARLTATGGKRLSFDLVPEAPFLRPFGEGGGPEADGRAARVTAHGDEIEVVQHLQHYDVRFYGLLKVVTDGVVTAGDGMLAVRDADEATLFFSCATNYRLSPEAFQAVTPRGFPAALQEKSVAAYGEAVRDLLALLPSAETREAVAWLRLMANRCETSILHIRSMMALDEIFGLYDYDSPAPLAPTQAKAIHSALERARGCAEAYLRLYGDILPDRGGEGQLVSYHETTLAYIDAVAAPFVGKAAPDAQAALDSPPMPDPEAAFRDKRGAIAK